MPLARGFASAFYGRSRHTRNPKGLMARTKSMKPTRLAVAAAAVVMAVGCGGGNGGTGPSNAAPVAKFSHSCTLLDCTFTNASTDADGTVASYNWTFGETGSSTNTSTDPSPSHTYAAPNTYHVTLTVTDDKGLASAVADSTINVSDVLGNTNPTANFTASCTALDCVFTDASTDADLGDAVASWSWNFDDASPVSTEQNPSHSYTGITTPTTKHVTLTVTDGNGGTGTVTKDVAITPAGGLTCDNGSGTFTSCALPLSSKSTVTITLTTADCTANGNTLKITSPIMQTIFTNGCHNPIPGTPAATIQLNGPNSDKSFDANTDLQAQVTSGTTATDRIPPAVRVSGAFPHWTLNFDDGEGCPGDVTCGGTEPDFNDLVLDVNATVVP